MKTDIITHYGIKVYGVPVPGNKIIITEHGVTTIWYNDIFLTQYLPNAKIDFSNNIEIFIHKVDNNK